MPDSLQAAFELADRIRFAGDRRAPMRSAGALQASGVHYQFNQSGLRISREMTPSVHAVFSDVFERLSIIPGAIEAYVYASPEIQAGCYAGDSSECFITITSGLIHLMSEDELAFVVGHEIGHFLCGHGGFTNVEAECTESLMLQRGQEISADRFGILAAGSGEVAYKALIKTTSGLPDELLRFDVGTFLNQIRRGGRAESEASQSTHPSLVMRCRALLWFSMSDEFARLTGSAGKTDLVDIDRRIEKDLARYVDGPARQRIKDAAGDMRFWLAVTAAVRDGALDKDERAKLECICGQETLKKLLGLLSGRSREEVNQIVRDKLESSVEFYRRIAPREYERSAGMLEEQVGRDFTQLDFQQYLRGRKD